MLLAFVDAWWRWPLESPVKSNPAHKQELESIAPLTMIATLEAFGWVRSPVQKGRSGAFGFISFETPQGRERAYVEVPSSRLFGDYARRLDEVVAVVAYTEKMSERQLLNRLLGC